MTWIDLPLLGWLAYAAWRGYQRGLVLTLTSLLGWVGGLILATRYSLPASQWFSSVTPSPAFQQVFAFVSLVILCLFLFYGAGLLVRSFLRVVHLGILDRISGAGFGTLKVLLVLLTVLSIAGPYLSHSELFHRSRVGPVLLHYAPFARQLSETVTRTAREQLRPSLHNAN